MGCFPKVYFLRNGQNLLMPTIFQAPNNLQKLNQNRSVFFFQFSSFLTVYLSFCGLIKGISPKMCILCVRVKINKRSFEPFLGLVLLLSRFFFYRGFC